MTPVRRFDVARWGVMSEYTLEAWILLCEAYCGRALPGFFKRVVACLMVYTIVVVEGATFRETYLKGFNRGSGACGMTE